MCLVAKYVQKKQLVLWEIHHGKDGADIFVEYRDENAPKSDWEKRYDTKNRRSYYVNHKTHNSQWVQPMGVDSFMSLQRESALPHQTLAVNSGRQSKISDARKLVDMKTLLQDIKLTSNKI